MLVPLKRERRRGFLVSCFLFLGWGKKKKKVKKQLNWSIFLGWYYYCWCQFVIFFVWFKYLSHFLFMGLSYQLLIYSQQLQIFILSWDYRYDYVTYLQIHINFIKNHIFVCFEMKVSVFCVEFLSSESCSEKHYHYTAIQISD